MRLLPAFTICCLALLFLVQGQPTTTINSTESTETASTTTTTTTTTPTPTSTTSKQPTTTPSSTGSTATSGPIESTSQPRVDTDTSIVPQHVNVNNIPHNHQLVSFKTTNFERDIVGYQLRINGVGANQTIIILDSKAQEYNFTKVLAQCACYPFTLRTILRGNTISMPSNEGRFCYHVTGPRAPAWAKIELVDSTVRVTFPNSEETVCPGGEPYEYSVELRYKIIDTDYEYFVEEKQVVNGQTPVEFSNLKPGYEYYARVYTMDADDLNNRGTGISTESVFYKQGVPRPTEPKDFNVTKYSEREVHLEWLPSFSPNGSTISYYMLTVTNLKTQTKRIVFADGSPTYVKNLDSCTNYQIDIRAIDAMYSTPATVTFTTTNQKFQYIHVNILEWTDNKIKVVSKLTTGACHLPTLQYVVLDLNNDTVTSVTMNDVHQLMCPYEIVHEKINMTKPYYVAMFADGEEVSRTLTETNYLIARRSTNLRLRLVDSKTGQNAIWRRRYLLEEQREEHRRNIAVGIDYLLGIVNNIVFMERISLPLIYPHYGAVYLELQIDAGIKGKDILSDAQIAHLWNYTMLYGQHPALFAYRYHPDNPAPQIGERARRVVSGSAGRMTGVSSLVALLLLLAALNI